jgi:ABC-2 type transport system permease protein
MLSYLTLEVRRLLRDRRFAFFTIIFPVALYLLWTNIFSEGRDEITGLTVPSYLMVSLASYGAIGAALNTTGVRLATERQTGWLRQLQVTPLPAWAVITVKTIAAMTLALPSLTLVGLTAALTQDVRLSAVEWIGMIALLCVGTLPFAAMGTLIGSLVSAEAGQPVMMICYFTLAIAGGLWVPVSQLPDAFRSISTWLPSNRLAELGWDIAGGHAPSGSALLVLAAWTAGLGALAIAAYRRATLNS